MLKKVHHLNPFLRLALLLLFSSLTLYGQTLSLTAPRLNITEPSTNFFLKSDSSLWCVDSDINTPPSTKYIASQVMQVAGDNYHGLFLKEDGSVWQLTENKDGTFTQKQLCSNGKAISANYLHFMILKTDNTLLVYDFKSDTPSLISLANNVCSAQLTLDGAVARKTDGSLWAYPHLPSHFDKQSISKYPCIKLSDQIISYQVDYANVTFLTPKNELFYWYTSSVSPQLVTTQVKQCVLPLVLKKDDKLYMLDSPNYDTLKLQLVSENVEKINEPLASPRLNPCTFIKKDSTLWAYNPCSAGLSLEVTQLSDQIENMAFNDEMGFVTLKDGSLWYFGGTFELEFPNVQAIPSFTLPSNWCSFKTQIFGIPIATDFASPDRSALPADEKVIGYELLPSWVSQQIKKGFEVSDVMLASDSSFAVTLNYLSREIYHSQVPFTFTGKNEQLADVTFYFKCEPADSINRFQSSMTEAQKEAHDSFTYCESLLSSSLHQTISLSDPEISTLINAGMNQKSCTLQKEGYRISIASNADNKYNDCAFATLSFDEAHALSIPDIAFSVPYESTDTAHLMHLGYDASQIDKSFTSYAGILLRTLVTGKKSFSPSSGLQLTKLSFERPLDTPEKAHYTAIWTLTQDDFYSNSSKYIEAIKNDVLHINQITGSTAKSQDLDAVLAQLQTWSADFAENYFSKDYFIAPSDHAAPNPYDYGLCLENHRDNDHTVTIRLSW